MNNKNKVYLSKSFNCKNDINLILFTDYLNTLDLNITSSALLNSDDLTLISKCNYLLIYPPDIKRDLVGKGQYHQIKYALENNIDVLFVNSVCKEDGITEVNVTEVNDIKIHDDTNWTHKYGVVNTNQMAISLINYDGFHYKKVQNTPTTIVNKCSSVSNFCNDRPSIINKRLLITLFLK